MTGALLSFAIPVYRYPFRLSGHFSYLSLSLSLSLFLFLSFSLSAFLSQFSILPPSPFLFLSLNHSPPSRCFHSIFNCIRLANNERTVGLLNRRITQSFAQVKMRQGKNTTMISLRYFRLYVIVMITYSCTFASY